MRNEPQKRAIARVLFIVVIATLVSFWNFRALGGHLEELIQSVNLRDLSPLSQSFGKPEGSPEVIRTYNKDGKLSGYIFLNSDFAGSTGYSGKPIHILLGLDLNGEITGAKLVKHSEPIVLIGIPEPRIRKLISDFIGRKVSQIIGSTDLTRDVDIISGATVTIMVISDSILRSAVKVARKYGLAGLKPDKENVAGGKIEIADTGDQVRSWPELTGDGSVRSLKVTVQDINAAFENSNDPEAAKFPEKGGPEETFLDLKVALVSIPTIGKSLLGEREFKNLQNRLTENQSAILLMGNGRYSFRGSGFVRGGLFDRFQVIQADNSIRFRDKQYKRLSRVYSEGAPAFDEVALFRIPDEAQFRPQDPWRIQLLVGRETAPREKAFLTLDLDYQLPKHFLKVREAAERQDLVARTTQNGNDGQAGTALDSPLWKRLWRQKMFEIVLVVAALTLLTIIFFFQDWLAQRPQLTDRIRLGFLVFTLFGIGFYANAQLSLVNVMTFFNSLLTEFNWSYFLRDPLIFLLWFAVAASLIFWGRGAFCGWLCPFGAFQELLNRGAKWVGITQIRVPWWLHERLWPIKYIIFLVVFGVSLNSLALAEQLAEVEPFKTAIILKFMRDWPFVLFAVALLAAGLFIERIYCRYLCPLGAALAIPGKLRLFEWLKRYKHCGSPCQLCAGECMVQAIHPEGNINPNECLYCLHCQTVYHNSRRCPVVIQKRLRQERHSTPPLGQAFNKNRKFNFISPLEQRK